jgi:quinol monooxygenase YgiN
MIKLIFDYEIAAERQEEYFRETMEKIKPLWESKGCRSYTVWQEAENPTRFVKEMLFEDVASLKETMALEETDAVKEIFRAFARNVSRRVIAQKI